MSQVPDPAASGGVDPQVFRNGLSRFASGVSVITTCDAGGGPVGITVSAFASVSLRPPLVLFCLDLATASLAAFRAASAWTVNILAEGQQPVSELFASHRPERFEVTPHHPGENGCPVISGCLATLECSRFDVHGAGDHLIFIGRVDRVQIGTGKPLLYYRGGYCRLALLTPAPHNH